MMAMNKEKSSQPRLDFKVVARYGSRPRMEEVDVEPRRSGRESSSRLVIAGYVSLCVGVALSKISDTLDLLFWSGVGLEFLGFFLAMVSLFRGKGKPAQLLILHCAIFLLLCVLHELPRNQRNQERLRQIRFDQLSHPP